VLTVPFIGGLADRIGVRKVAIGTLALFGLSFAALAFTPASLFAFYLLWIVMGALGGGSTPVTWTRAVNAWFVHNRGLALALTLMGTGVTAALLPSLATWLIGEFGWRKAFIGIAAALAVSLPVAYWLFPRPTTRTACTAAVANRRSPGPAARLPVLGDRRVGVMRFDRGRRIHHQLPATADRPRFPGTGCGARGWRDRDQHHCRPVGGGLPDRQVLGTARDAACSRRPCACAAARVSTSAAAIATADRARCGAETNWLFSRRYFGSPLRPDLWAAIFDLRLRIGFRPSCWKVFIYLRHVSPDPCSGRALLFSAVGNFLGRYPRFDAQTAAIKGDRSTPIPVQGDAVEQFSLRPLSRSPS
jgi:hypothetical protein